MWTVSLPLRVQVTASDWFPLNLNVYRNAHFRTLDKAKKEFHERVKPLVKHIPTVNKAFIHYTLWTPTNAEPDTANICAIADKFFSDTLVAEGKLEDDKCSILPHLLFSWGGVDRNNPRVDATIHSIGPNFDIQVIDGLVN